MGGARIYDKHAEAKVCIGKIVEQEKELNYTIDAWDPRKIGVDEDSRGYSIYDEDYDIMIYNIS